MRAPRPENGSPAAGPTRKVAVPDRLVCRAPRMAERYTSPRWAAGRRGSIPLLSEVTDDPAYGRDSVRVAEVPGILVRLGLAALPHAAQLVDHLLKALFVSHRATLSEVRRRSNAQIAAGPST